MHKSRKVKHHQSRLKAHRYLVKAIGREMANAFRQLEERSYRGNRHVMFHRALIILRGSTYANLVM